ncbi:hypothetical protein [Bombilactobacillus bombi]
MCGEVKGGGALIVGGGADGVNHSVTDPNERSSLGVHCGHSTIISGYN